MAFAMEGGIGEDALPLLNAWGRRCIIVWGDEVNDKKNKKNILCRGLKWLSIRTKKCNNQQKMGAFNGGGCNMMCERRGACGGGAI